MVLNNTIIYLLLFSILFMISTLLYNVYVHTQYDNNVEGLQNKGILTHIRMKKNKHITRPFRKFREKINNHISNIYHKINKVLF